jgi:Flp pilus assembly protein TadG
MVEFSLSFLVFLGLVVGLMEFGRGVWTYTTLSHAARRGARFAMVHRNGTNAEVATIIKANAVGLDPAKIVVDTPTWTPNREPGSVVVIRVSYPFELVTGGLIVQQSTLQLQSTTQMLVVN